MDKKERILTPVDITVLDYPPPPIRFKNKHFVFCGEFIHGSRAKHEEQVRKHGGMVDDTITTDTDYLVIGARPAKAWKEQIYRAVEFRQRLDCHLKIVSGFAFTGWLRATIRGRTSEAMLDELEAVYSRWLLDTLELPLPDSWSWSQEQT